MAAIVTDLVRPVVTSLVGTLMNGDTPRNIAASEYQVTADGVAVTADGDPVLASP